jgi:hypothetical protein
MGQSEIKLSFFCVFLLSFFEVNNPIDTILLTFNSFIIIIYG